MTYCRRYIYTLSTQKAYGPHIWEDDYLLRIVKKYQRKKQKNCENEVIISHFVLIHPIPFFFIEKEEYLFHMDLKTTIRMFYLERLTKTLY